MICNYRELKELFNCVIDPEDAFKIVKEVSTDTRTIVPASVFVAIRGENFDGHDFVYAAMEKGALAVIVDKNFINDKGIKDIIVVDDTVKAYGKLASFYRHKCGFKVVAITGSSGKTTTKDMVSSVVKRKYGVEKTFKNNNNEIGLPYTILNTLADKEVLVLEMGMRSLGEIKYLTEIADPDIGIITNIGIAHIGELGSQDNILKAKGELFENMRPESVAIINGEDGFDKKLRDMFQGRKIVFGFGDDADIRAVDLSENNGETSFTMIYSGNTKKVKLPYIGKHLILDSLIAIAVGSIFDISVEEAIVGLNEFEISPGRLEHVRRPDCLIINDTYNANPESMKASLDILAGYPGLKIAVLGDMKELGDREIIYHREIGAYINEKGIDYLISVGDLAFHIADESQRLGKSADRIHKVKNNIEAAGILVKLIRNRPTILIKGSRAMAMEEIIELLEDMS